MMNIQHYKDRLSGLEKELSARTARAVAEARQQVRDAARDAGDASIADEAASDAFSEADRDSFVLQQVIDALLRVDNGTFGRCSVDGEPIEEKRLEAVPWTSYCRRHADALEISVGVKTPTL